MSEHTSSNRGRLWLILLGALVAALVSMLALVHWDSTARADEQTANEISLKRSSGSAEDRLAELMSKGDFHSQIVGGKPVPNGKYPFMAVLLVNTGAGTSLCGGSLIDKDSVLSAGHCFFDGNGNLDVVSVDVFVGRTVRSMASQGQFRRASFLYWHNNFDLSRNFSNDAAVLKLESAVSGIKPIKLATARQDGLEKPGRMLTAAGWGTTSEGGSTSDRMRVVSVPVVSDAKAQKAYATQSPVLRFFPKLMVAAGQKGKDACQGDSGGPLFKSGATSTTQVGIVSYGKGCARAAFPGVYTEVNNPNIRSFIVNAAQR